MVRVLLILVPALLWPIIAAWIFNVREHGADAALMLILFSWIFVLYFGLRAVSFYYLPSFSAYKASHPELAQPNGKVRCFKCGDTGRRMWRWSAHFPIGPKKHYCSQCGKALYRS
jgi:hypothetical protein